MSTDAEWEKWGRKDPYYGVLTNERYRGRDLPLEAREQFFATGERHVAGVLDECHRLFGTAFAPRRVLDFGCGVGRLTVPFAQKSDHVVGVDVSPAMLNEAMRNCVLYGVRNVAFAMSDDTLSQVDGKFDLVHTAITLQHIEVARGRELFARLVDKILPKGVGAIQVTYAKARYEETFGQAPVTRSSSPVPLSPSPGTLSRLLRRLDGTGGGAEHEDPFVETGSGDPEMRMISYPLGELAFLLQSAGVRRFHADFTNHGGELGVFLFFQKPESW